MQSESLGDQMKKGETVPDFEAINQEGASVSLSSMLENGPVVLFFYPKAMTPGCTAESCHFRDLESEFSAIGAQPVGISVDQVEKQKEFDDKHQLGFPLLSDPDQTIASILGAKRMGPFGNKRITYVIGADRTILEVIKSETNMNVHADTALDILKK